jgi:hypothetical protein
MRAAVRADPAHIDIMRMYRALPVDSAKRTRSLSLLHQVCGCQQSRVGSCCTELTGLAHVHAIVAGARLQRARVAEQGGERGLRRGVPQGVEGDHRGLRYILSRRTRLRPRVLSAHPAAETPDKSQRPVVSMSTRSRDERGETPLQVRRPRLALPRRHDRPRRARAQYAIRTSPQSPALVEILKFVLGCVRSTIVSWLRVVHRSRRHKSVSKHDKQLRERLAAPSGPEWRGILETAITSVRAPHCRCSCTARDDTASRHRLGLYCSSPRTRTATSLCS